MSCHVNILLSCFRKTRNINWDNFKLDLRHYLSNKRSSVTDDTNYLESLISIYEDSVTILDKHAPLIERTIPIRKRTPFKKDKRRAEKKWRLSKDINDLAVYKETNTTSC